MSGKSGEWHQISGLRDDDSYYVTIWIHEPFEELFDISRFDNNHAKTDEFADRILADHAVARDLSTAQERIAELEAEIQSIYADQREREDQRP